MLPIECIVRGYITGSGWASYQKTGKVCGITLPEGLRESDKLPEPIYTPSTKADLGDHDENISYEQSIEVLEKHFPGQEVRRLRPEPRHHHCGHQVRVRPGRGRQRGAGR